MSTSLNQPATSSKATVIIATFISLGLFVLIFLLTALSGGSQAIALFVPAFLAGVLSFLSPCTLPVLPAYFAWTFGINSDSDEPLQRKQRRTILSSLAFFSGLATTLILITTLLTTALGRSITGNLGLYTKVGGGIIFALGVLTLLGKGFSGPAIKHNASATLGGAYVYGMTFALGWTACIGPILGSILTLLIASGASIIAGASLTLVYVLGLAIPLMIVSTFFNKLGQGSRGWRFLRGRAWEVRLGSRTIMLHSTNVLSGILLMFIGILLFTGTLNTLSTYSMGGLSEWANDIQYDITAFFERLF